MNRTGTLIVFPGGQSVNEVKWWSDGPSVSGYLPQIFRIRDGYDAVTIGYIAFSFEMIDYFLNRGASGADHIGHLLVGQFIADGILGSALAVEGRQFKQKAGKTFTDILNGQALDGSMGLPQALAQNTENTGGKFRVFADESGETSSFQTQNGGIFHRLGIDFAPFPAADLCQAEQ